MVFCPAMKCPTSSQIHELWNTETGPKSRMTRKVICAFRLQVQSFVQLCSFVTIPGALRMCLQTCYRYNATLMHYVHLSACCDAHTCLLCGQLVIALAYICSGIIRWPSNIRYLLSLSSSFVLHLGSPKQYFLTFPLSDSRLGLCTMPESQDTYRLRLFRNNAS